MIFVIDNALSPVVSKHLKEKGFDSLHVHEYDMQTASDEKIFSTFHSPQHIIVSADTDFGTILDQRQSQFPSVILFRQSTNRSPHKQANLLKRIQINTV